jgi:prophage tail gpP-like protein
VSGAQPESLLEVRFNLLGRTETRFKSWSIDSAYLTSTDGFSFDLYPARREDGQFLELQPCELTVDGASQVLGRIDKTRIGHDGSVVTCEGRDYLSDLVECNCDPNLSFDAKTELADLIHGAASPCGIFEITDFENILMAEIRSGRKIRRKPRKRRKRKLEQSYKPKPGEGIFEFINRPTARNGATIQPGPDRNTLVIDAPDYTQDASYELIRSDDPNAANANNIVSGEAERDYSSFPTYALFVGTFGQQGQQTGGDKKLFKMKELSEAFNSEMGRILQRAIAPDRNEVFKSDAGFKALLYRLLFFRDQDARSPEDLESAAKRAIADRLKDTLRYTCTVRGHKDPRTGAVYSVNTIANVNDAICNVHEPLWVAKRTLRYDENQGALCDLELWRPESFQIAEEAK